MIEGHQSVVVVTVVRVLVPLMQLFAVYVLVHGHESPGGGFQAGVMAAASYIALALALGRDERRRRRDERLALTAGCAGVGLYLGTGVVPMLRGGRLLDYAALPLPVDAAHARHLGILGIEIGVAIAVAATLILIFSRLARGEPPR